MKGDGVKHISYVLLKISTSSSAMDPAEITVATNQDVLDDQPIQGNKYSTLKTTPIATLLVADEHLLWATCQRFHFEGSVS